MTILRRILTGAAALAAACSAASATTIGFTTTFDAGTGSTYTLTLPDFDAATFGTLTGVRLYLYATETSSNFTIANPANSDQFWDLAVTTNLSSAGTNSATAADKFGNEVVTLFDTGGGPDTNGALGGCLANPTTTVKIACAGTQFLASGNSVNYAPITISNIDSNYSAANNTDPNSGNPFGINTGTGFLGTTGAFKNGTNITNYIGTGSFNLTGNITGGTSFFTAGTPNEQLTQTTTTSYVAEVDYDFTPSAIPSAPEPATMALMGGALLGLGLLGKRLKRG